MPLPVPAHMKQSSGLMHSWVMPMEEFIHQKNLERYRKMLFEKTHEPQRQTILRLLADEETRDDTTKAAA
jgi:hypothetical protein